MLNRAVRVVHSARTRVHFALAARCLRTAAESEAAADPQLTAARGTLYMVTTPIGNLSDVSERCRGILTSADVIAAEDTRVSRQLVTAITSHTDKQRTQTFMKCNEFNEEVMSHKLHELLSRGKSVAYVSDGGTPAISDPGAFLAQTAHKHAHKIVGIPGPCAITTALSISGVELRWGFRFFGFIPREGEERKKGLLAIHEHTRKFLSKCTRPVPLVLYEAPHRLEKTLQELSELIGAVPVVICRELTKVYEECIRYASLQEAVQAARTVEPRGEYVLILYSQPVLDGEHTEDITGDDALLLVKELKSRGTATSTAVTHVAEVLGISKKVLYRRVLSDETVYTPKGR